MSSKLQTGSLLVLSLLIIFTFSLVASEESQDDLTFRSTRWGMSKSEVIEREGEPDVRRDVSSNGFTANLIYENLTVGGLDTALGYVFTENKLVRGAYLFQEDHSNNNLYIEDYRNIKNILTDKYGHPEEEGPEWSKKTYQGNTDQYGFAISIGDLAFQATWETEKTTIWERLKGDNYTISHRLYYDSKKFKDFIREKSEEQTQSQF